MGRLDDIIDRNKHPARHRKMRFPVGIMLSAFVLLVLILMIFTDLGRRPDDVPAPPAPADDGRVHDIKLWSPPAKP